MINMKMSAEEAKEYNGGLYTEDAPQYPYGLCIDLSDDTMKKLGITELPAVGAEMTLMAKVTVTRTGAYQTQGSDKESSMALQITDMELNKPAGRSIAESLYGKS